MSSKTTKSSHKTSAVWISYDLGVRGDYEGLYTWLDEHDARECGESLAFINYRYSGDLRDSLTTALTEAIETDKRTRLYVIYKDRETNKIKGRFVCGGRKSAPWDGFAGKER